MPEQTKIAFTVSPELNSLLDKAFERAASDSRSFPTRTEYIRYILECACLEEIKDHKTTTSPFVKDDLLNKVVWAILSRHQVSETDGNPFHGIHLDEFISKARVAVEEIFLLLEDKKCAKCYKDNNGYPTLHKFDFDAIKQIARDNIKSVEMQSFSSAIKNWNTGTGRPIDELCFTCFGNYPEKIKPILGNNGFIITKSSKCGASDFMKGVIVDSPSDYARQLWDIPVFKKNEKSTSLYVTFPDILL